MRTSWVRSEQVMAGHEVVLQLYMHEVSISRLKRRLEDAENELKAVISEVSTVIGTLSR